MASRRGVVRRLACIPDRHTGRRARNQARRTVSQAGKTAWNIQDVGWLALLIEPCRETKSMSGFARAMVWFPFARALYSVCKSLWIDKVILSYIIDVTTYQDMFSFFALVPCVTFPCGPSLSHKEIDSSFSRAEPWRKMISQKHPDSLVIGRFFVHSFFNSYAEHLSKYLASLLHQVKE